MKGYLGEVMYKLWAERWEAIQIGQEFWKAEGEAYSQAWGTGDMGSMKMVGVTPEEWGKGVQSGKTQQ